MCDIYLSRRYFEKHFFFLVKAEYIRKKEYIKIHTGENHLKHLTHLTLSRFKGYGGAVAISKGARGNETNRCFG